VAEGDRRRYQAGVHHLENVFVFELFADVDDRHRRLPGGTKRHVQCLEAFVIAARPTHVDFTAREILRSREWWLIGCRHHELTDIAHDWCGEIDLLLVGGSDDQRGRRDITPPFLQRLEDAIAADRNKGHVHGNGRRLQPLVQEVFEQLCGLIGRTVLFRLVDEVVRLAEGDEHPDVPALDHGFEIALPWRKERSHRRVGWR
jgi:hypothetical protein